MQQSRGDGADREGRAGEHGVAGDRVEEPDLGLVQAELALSELEFLFSQPPVMLLKLDRSLARCPGLG